MTRIPPRDAALTTARRRARAAAAILCFTLVTVLAAGCGGGADGGGTQTPPPDDTIHYPPMDVFVVPGDAEVELQFGIGVAASYEIYWSTTSGLPLQQRNMISGVVGGPYRHMNLANGTTYYYVVAWVDAQGNRYPQAEVSATPRIPYSPPRELTATPTQATLGPDGSVVLSWRAAWGYASFDVYWSTSPGVTRETGQKIANVVPVQWGGTWDEPVFGYEHAGLTGGTTYHYVVSGVTEKGSESAATSEASATPPAAVTIARFSAEGSRAWARGVNGCAVGEAVASLPDGSFYLAGRFRGPVVLGAGEPSETTLDDGNPYCSADGLGAMFLARYGPDGALAWAKMGTLSRLREPMTVAALPDGSAVVAGSFWGNATFGAGEPGETTLLALSSTADVFVARYAPSGALTWARSAGWYTSIYGGGHEARAVAALADGSVVVTGSFYEHIEFPAGGMSAIALDTQYGCGTFDFDAFVARWNPGGDVVWARRAGGCAWEEGRGVTVASDGSIRVTGSFAGSAGGSSVFGPGEASQTTLSSSGYADLFVASYAAETGMLAWARRAGGAENDAGIAVAALPGGAAGVAARVGGPATFGPGEAGEQIVTPGAPAAVARYGADGALSWVRGMSGDGWLRAIASQPDGSISIAGSLEASASFGSGPSGEVSLSAPHPDAFLAQYAVDGTPSWAVRLDRGPSFTRAVASSIDGSTLLVASRLPPPQD